MNGFNLDNFIKYHSAYHNAFYGIIIAMSVLSRLLKYTENTSRVVIFCLVMLAILIADNVLFRVEYFDSMKVFSITKYIELIAINVIETLVAENGVLVAALIIVTLVLGLEYLIYGTDYDKTSVFVRKIAIFVPLGINLVITFEMINETNWICYTIANAISYVAMFFVFEWMNLQHSEFVRETNALKLNLSHVETDNEKLIEYQEKVKIINEQINYQKIDLAKAIKNLEQTNKEIESQTELMRFMTSTTDISKCLNLMADSIMEIKKAKVCAVYIDKDVFMNKLPVVVIRTNYTSMEQRLKKEIDKIFNSMAEGSKESVIVSGSTLECYRFIGETNLKTFAILPIIGSGRVNGLMLVGSDDEKFFENGLNYYESCIAELNVTLKSTILYLKTQDMARKDGLTGIYNRLYFNELIAEASKKAKDNNEYLSVALFDIDKFKSVNDTYGHLTGDIVIKKVAATAQKYAEKYKGFCCRYGGEEFLLVLPGYDEKDALKVYEQMHKEIKEAQIPYNNTVFSINVCIGFTTYPSLCNDTELLVSRADKAMYYGKEHGRGRLVMDTTNIDN